MRDKIETSPVSTQDFVTKDYSDIYRTMLRDNALRSLSLGHYMPPTGALLKIFTFNRESIRGFLQTIFDLQKESLLNADELLKEKESSELVKKIEALFETYRTLEQDYQQRSQDLFQEQLTKLLAQVSSGSFDLQQTLNKLSNQTLATQLLSTTEEQATTFTNLQGLTRAVSTIFSTVLGSSAKIQPTAMSNKAAQTAINIDFNSGNQATVSFNLRDLPEASVSPKPKGQKRNTASQEPKSATLIAKASPTPEEIPFDPKLVASSSKTLCISIKSSELTVNEEEKIAEAFFVLIRSYRQKNPLQAGGIPVALFYETSSEIDSARTLRLRQSLCNVSASRRVQLANMADELCPQIETDLAWPTSPSRSNSYTRILFNQNEGEERASSKGDRPPLDLNPFGK